MNGSSLFSVILLGNTTAANATGTFNTTTLDLTNGDFEARAAVRGGVRLRSFGVNQGPVCNLTGSDAAQFGFIVEGNGTFDFTNGQIACGSLLVSEGTQVVNLPGFGTSGAGLVVRCRRLSAIPGRLNSSG